MFELFSNYVLVSLKLWLLYAKPILMYQFKLK